MKPGRIGVCLFALALALVSTAEATRANDDLLRALGLGLGVVNSLQQQQQQQQQQPRPQQQRQATPQRQVAAPARPRAVDTAAAQRQRAAVADVQEALNRLGYDAGPVDGDPGPRTRSAIAAFRADYGLDPGTGIDDQLAGAIRVAARNAPAGAGGWAAARAPGTVGAPQAVSPPLWDEPEPANGRAAAVTEVVGGALWVDGRFAARSGLVSWGDAVPEGFDVDGNLARLVRDFTFASDDAWRTTDAAAVAALGALEPPVLMEIVQEATGRPIDRSDLYNYESGQGGYALRSLSPFELQRAIAGLRARADLLVRRDLPPLPLPLRVYCTLDLGDYDFATSSFPVTRMDECNMAVDGAPGSADRSGRVWSAPLPDRLPYPPEAAEAFNTLVRDTNFFLASFDTDLAIDVITSESTQRTAGSLSDRRNFVLYQPGSFTQVLRQFDAGGAGATAPAVGVERSWDISESGQRAELLALAGPPRQPPLDGRELLRAAPGDQGVFTDKYPEWGDAEHWAGKAAAASDPRRSRTIHYRVTEALATALGVPGEHLVSLAHIENREPMSSFYGLLPAPSDAYARDPRADLYGRHRIGYAQTTRITGVHAIAMTPGEAPVLLLTLAPIEGRFLDGERAYDRAIEPAVLERFDLATPSTLSADYQTISGPWRLGLVAQAAKALGADLAEVIGNTVDAGGMDPFEKNDLVTRLVAHAEAQSDPIDTFWIAGDLKMGDYDFKTQAFAPYELKLRQIDGPGAEDLPSGAIRLAIDREAFAIRMPHEEARAFAQAYPKYRELPIRARVTVTGSSLDPGAVRLAVDILEYEVLTEGSTATVLEPARVIYRWAPPQSGAFPFPEAQVEAAAAAEPAPVAAPLAAPPAVARDILGITLSSPLDRALDTVATEVGPTAEYAVTRDQLPQRVGVPEVKAWGSFGTATLFHNDASRVSIALFTEPPAAADQVTAILRTQSFVDAGRPHPDAIERILREKYGAPTGIGTELPFARVMLWYDRPPSQSRCDDDLRDEARTAAIELHNRPRSKDASGLHWPSIWRDPSGAEWKEAASGTMNMRKTFLDFAECEAIGEVLIALVMTDPDGLVGNFQLALANPAEAGRLVRLNEEATQEVAPTPASGLEVKL